MATPALAFNPLATTVFNNSFSVESDGFVQGVAMDDPAVRFALAGGVLDSAETFPMWGGVGIYMKIPSSNRPLGPPLGRATSIAGATPLLGFSVFNQAHAWMSTPQSPVPTAASGMTVPFFPLNSGARIAVKINPGLVSLEGGMESQQVSWDFAGQQLTTYSAAYAANVITASSWASTGGGQATFTTTTSHGVSVGSDFTISGETPSGYNGTFTAITGTTGSTLVAALTTNPGSSTVQGTLVAGGGALPCKILRINAGNSKVVVWDATAATATWNNSGYCALIQI